MKKYIVQSWVNNEASDGWEFDNRKESLEFYKAKVKNLSKERKEENQQALGKLKDEDEFTYTWFDVENEWEGLRKSKKWRDVKKEREKDEN